MRKLCPLYSEVSKPNLSNAARIAATSLALERGQPLLWMKRGPGIEGQMAKFAQEESFNHFLTDHAVTGHAAIVTFGEGVVAAWHCILPISQGT